MSESTLNSPISLEEKKKPATIARNMSLDETMKLIPTINSHEEMAIMEYG